ncbi:uncharacterized protein [Diadema setosum]|uniref:uncharacterized protein n=1 Tax=Diadema setosum TaxID=31175 RepID=UPI003B3B64C3
MNYPASIMFSLLIFSSLIIAHVSAANELYLNVNSRTVSQGTANTFTCYSNQLSDSNIFTTGGMIEWFRYPQFSSNQQLVASWTREGGPRYLLTDPADVDRFTLVGALSGYDRVNQQLKIRSTTRSDQGEYYCVVYDGQGSKLMQSLPVQLTVKYPPADHFPLCTATPLGGTLKLRCESENTTPDVVVQWYKDNNKVADGVKETVNTVSSYTADPSEFSSQFECRVSYDDNLGIQETQICRFSLPYVMILRMVGESTNQEITYYAFAHSSPPFVSDLSCNLETPTSTPNDFRLEFPGYGVMKVGPVPVADNGTQLVCRAENVFGAGETQMTVYSNGDGSVGVATLPSLVTNYVNNEGSLVVSIWPEVPSVAPGQSVTFFCSHSLTAVHASSHARVSISWRFNDVPVDVTSSDSRFSMEGNTLRVDDIEQADDGARVTCRASVVVEEMAFINIPGKESTTTISVSTEMGCQTVNGADTAIGISQPGGNSVLHNQSFVIGVLVLAAVGWLALIIVVLLIVTQRRKKNRSRFAGATTTSQITFRASSNGVSHRNQVRAENVIPSPVQRALPMQPSQKEAQSDTQVNTTMDVRMTMSNGASKPATTYESMVGHTGVTRSRNPPSSNGVTNAVPNGHGIARSLQTSAPVMVPGPQGGFVPQSLASTPSEASGEEECGDMKYEELDCIKQQHVPLATGNDYQTSVSNTPRMHELDELLPHYANS